MLRYRMIAMIVLTGGVAACASQPEPPPPPACPPGQVMTYAGGCVTPDPGNLKSKGEYVPYKPLKTKDTAMTGEEDTNPFGKAGSQSIYSVPKK